MPLTTRKNKVRKVNCFTTEIDAPFDGSTAVPQEDSALSLDEFVITEDIFEYPREDRVPPGYYACELQHVEPRFKNGKKILDVGYELIDRKGEAYYILQSYPLGSQPYKALCRALIAAGVKPGSNMKTAIGVREAVELAYVSKYADIGSIIRRLPEREINLDDEDDMPLDDDEA